MMAVKREIPPSAVGSDDLHTILGPESTFEGKLVFNGGRVVINGTFKGEIVTDSTVMVGESARVEANIQVGALVVTGEVHGDVTAKQSVSIERPGKLRGTIDTPELMIEKGVVFEGTCTMGASREPARQAKVTVLKDPKHPVHMVAAPPA
jgi:cytoskeletal protein CcmA (bactofilin family)